ncbi:Glycerophosphoryl diester phosphodiesterase family [Shewanella psychrophila]|uniref:glycerophosphodiester phosphodiesterase n=1 Tax=Shewanella psychrophila TaxID=225848 RepID=A0A1S6HUW0_9GAMM|nr:glycerophosphodiester phosphodiesterase family protein [Shewanella psychrophila]AQS39272.1 Glycerophosphoryl diester phosphodiesterase family [Shewanella psychrophila]
MKKYDFRPYALLLTLATSLLLTACNNDKDNDDPQAKVAAQVGPRPLFLVRQMQDSELKTQLEQCTSDNFYRSDFSIGHRGAPMQFPEHTRESYQAAIDSGAGIVECDVTFTSDKALVCRHSQCDLATTTNILAIPELASQCTSSFTPADPINGVTASAQCCTSDITLAEFKTLRGKMDGANPNATSVEEYMAGTANWRTDLYSGNGTLMTHLESIEMFDKAGIKMTPELKEAMVQMPFDGFSQQDYAQKMLDEYTAAGIDPARVYPQSFHLEDIQYWIASAPEFASQAVFLDDRYDDAGFDPQSETSWAPSMPDLKAQGVEIIAPPLWVLVTLDNEGKLIPSEYANAANDAGLKIIAWSLERSGLLADGGGWYYQSISDAIDNEGDVFELLDVLAKDIGVMGVFSDWPSTVTYYANCTSK